jgi:hypothetical protein
MKFDLLIISRIIELELGRMKLLKYKRKCIKKIFLFDGIQKYRLLQNLDSVIIEAIQLVFDFQLPNHDFTVSGIFPNVLQTGQN